MLFRMNFQIMYFLMKILGNTPSADSAVSWDSLSSQILLFVSGQNICIAVYGNSVGTFTPILKEGNVHFCVLFRPLLEFSAFYFSCHSRIFKMFYLEMNLCRKCSENENEVQFCANNLKSIRDWFLEWVKGY